jgi:hypothetical protein
MHPIAGPFQVLYFSDKNSRNQMAAECRLKIFWKQEWTHWIKIPDIA